MKRLVCMICGCWLFLSGIAQTTSLGIATDKTVSLVFPFPIRHVDIGTKDVLVKQVEEADNILLVKAANKDFSETNLSVVTGDGNIYSFRVNYNNQTFPWVYHLAEIQKASVSTYSNGILDNPKTMSGIRDKSWDIQADIIGIYIKENVLYYQLCLENQSSIDYDIDFVRFYIRDKKKGKRTATQENELKPLYVAGNTKQIMANNHSVIVVALDKFTIPDAKYLAVQINERNGGRHLLLKVGNRKIIRAKILPDLH
jgi:conjugative transposon TraN protein